MQSEEGIRRRAAQACQLLLLPSLLFSNLVCQIVSGACLQYDPSCNPALGYIVFQAQEKSSSCSPACPSNYICVPANPAVGITADFCVAKYEMKCVGDATGASCTGPATSQAANQPRLRVLH